MLRKKLLIKSLFILLLIVGCDLLQEEDAVTSNTTVPIGTTFFSTFGGSNHDQGASVQQTIDGGYIITGYTISFEDGFRDVYLIKTDSLGKLEWEKTFDGMGKSVQQTIDGGYIITGYLLGDVLLIKTDSLGILEWYRTFPSSNEVHGTSVQQTTDGGYVITGSNNSSGNSDACLIKTDSFGILEWEKTFGGSEDDKGNSVQQTIDGGYIITGYTTSFGIDSSDVYLIKTDSLGIYEWEKTFDGNDWDYGNSVQQTTDGGYIITGKTGLYPNTDLLLIKTDSWGNELWYQTHGNGYGWGKSVQQTIDGGYIITGYLLGDVLLIKTDSWGNELWYQTIGGGNNDYGNSVQQTTDGGYIITGETYSYGNGGLDLLLIKTDSEGHTVSYNK